MLRATTMHIHIEFAMKSSKRDGFVAQIVCDVNAFWTCYKQCCFTIEFQLLRHAQFGIRNRC